MNILHKNLTGTIGYKNISGQIQGTFSHIMKTFDIQYKQAQMPNIDLGIQDIAKKMRR
jgi:hypothetical protein